MKRAIVVNADGRFVSAIIPKGMATAIRAGDRVRVMETLDLRPYATVAPGNEATVVLVDFETGNIELVLDVHHDGLREWRNCILLAPYDTDDLLCGLAWEPARAYA